VGLRKMTVQEEKEQQGFDTIFRQRGGRGKKVFAALIPETQQPKTVFQNVKVEKKK